MHRNATMSATRIGARVKNQKEDIAGTKRPFSARF
jgi:hypothetical protein